MSFWENLKTEFSEDPLKMTAMGMGIANTLIMAPTMKANAAVQRQAMLHNLRASRKEHDRRNKNIAGFNNYRSPGSFNLGSGNNNTLSSNTGSGLTGTRKSNNTGYYSPYKNRFGK